MTYEQNKRYIRWGSYCLGVSIVGFLFAGSEVAKPVFENGFGPVFLVFLFFLGVMPHYILFLKKHVLSEKQKKHISIFPELESKDE